MLPPCTALHREAKLCARRTNRLIQVGHTVVVVEHHLELVRAADWILDLGPGPGEDGGRLVAQGPPQEIARSNGPTGRHLARAFDAWPA